MGMYCEVQGKNIKFGGLMSLASKGIVEAEGGCVVLSYRQVRLLVGAMWQKVYSGEFVKLAGYAEYSNEKCINGQHLLHTIGDLNKLHLLVEWLNDENNKEGELFFA